MHKEVCNMGRWVKFKFKFLSYHLQAYTWTWNFISSQAGINSVVTVILSLSCMSAEDAPWTHVYAQLNAGYGSDMAWQPCMQQQVKSDNITLWRLEVQSHSITILITANKVMKELKNQHIIYMEQNKRIDHFHICNSIWERSNKKSEISYNCTIELYIIFKLFPTK